MFRARQPSLAGVIPFVEEGPALGPLPNRYVIREDDDGRYLACLEAPNLAVRLDLGFVVSGASARRYPEGSIFLDGAAQGEPFMDVKRKVYNLDHHEGCVRAFTLATCEQAMVLLLKGLDLRGGQWTLYGNDPDLDTVLAIWVLLNHAHLTGKDSDVRQRLMPILRMQGAIDAHGLELRELTGLPDHLGDEVEAVINALRRDEVELKRAGRWHSSDVLEYTAEVLRAIDEVLYSPQHIDQLRDVQELTRVSITSTRWAIVCRSAVGIYEVEEYLKKVHGEQVGLIVLQKDPKTYTLRLADSFLPFTLEPFYNRLNQLDPNLTSTQRWGGSSDIGGSPRGPGTGLSLQAIATACSYVYQTPSPGRRVLRVLSQLGLALIAVLVALVVAWQGFPEGAWLGTLAEAEDRSQTLFGASLLVLALTYMVPQLRAGKRAVLALRRPLGMAWLAMFPLIGVAAIGGGLFGSLVPGAEPLGWFGASLSILAAEVLFRGALYGRLASVFDVAQPGGRWTISIPNAVMALAYAMAVIGLFWSSAWRFPAVDAHESALLMGGAAFALGLACGLAREHSGSLFAPLVLHLAAAGTIWAATGLLLS